MRYAGGLAVMLWMSCVGAAGAWDSPVPDVVIYCTPALEDVLRAAASRYSAADHVPVHIFVAAPDGMIGLVRHRARADLVAADAATVNAMAVLGLVRAESRTSFGKDPFVLIGNSGAAQLAGADAAALVQSYRTVLPDQTRAASFDGAAILHLAVPGVAEPDVQGVADTPDVLAAVRGNGRVVGLVNRTQANAPGVVEAAILSAPPARMEGALVVNGQSGNAKALLRFIASPKGQAVLHKFGLEDDQ